MHEETRLKYAASKIHQWEGRESFEAEGAVEHAEELHRH